MALSSYQKMKQQYEARIASLTRDITALVEEKDIVAVSEIKAVWQLRIALEKATWAGNAKPEPSPLTELNK